MTTTTFSRISLLLLLLLPLAFSQQPESHPILGCYFDDGLCNDNEFCFDDSLLGQCLPKDNPIQSLKEIPYLNDDARQLLSMELVRLTDGGFAWTDFYTQCVLKNILDTIQLGTTYDESACDIYLDDDDIDSENEEVVPVELLTNDEGSEDPITSVVPKKMIINDRFIPTNYIHVDEDGDGNIILEPNSEEILSNTISDEDDANQVEQEPNDSVEDDSSEEEGEFINPLEFQNFGADQSEMMDEPEDLQEEIISYPNQEEIVEAMREAIRNQEQNDGSEELDLPEVLWPTLDDTVYDDQDDTPNTERKLMKRNEAEIQPFDQQLDYDYGPDYNYEDTLASDIEPDYDDNDILIYSPNGINPGSEIAASGGLGSNIFNRNERLDVKKPGPFFKNSANNFFLDKIASESEDYLDSKENDTKPNVGQVEYEMPLLAPVKDKREMELEQNIEDPSKIKNFVHIALKNRFNTWNQGNAFVKLLAKEFNIPEKTLSDRLIENQHVQFHVDSNPRNLDAVQMAKRIDQDKDLHARIGDNIGVEIDRAIPGHRDDVKSILFPHGFKNLNLLLLMVVAASTTAAVLVVAVVLMLIKRRRRIRRKQDLMQNGEESAQDEYKQLCRDWSKSSKKCDPTIKAPHKKVQNQESKESNRSSTSSWPEEPSTSNMDISTGHMVLAYMEDHLKNKQRLEQEWVSLCGYEAEPCATTIAFKAENKKKNRYPDKLPYDHNRVILNAMVNASNSDYINASSITDHDPRNPTYIVTQAPLSSTVADFWQMIWEQGCVVIVMLTRLQDNGHQLCHRYWPEEGSEQYHIFEVHLVSEHVWCDDYLVRSVYLKNTRTGETRTVTQFHFRSWPAHGVPTSTKALLEFRRKVNKSYRGRSCPICIHCSDGVGRSGTYSLIDMVLNRMSKGCKEIDIAATLEHIRDQRGGMVQSRQQFEFCLMAVAEEVHAILKALPQ